MKKASEIIGRPKRFYRDLQFWGVTGRWPLPKGKGREVFTQTVADGCYQDAGDDVIRRRVREVAKNIGLEDPARE